VVNAANGAHILAFADAANTLHTLTVTGTALELDSISDSGLKVVDATALAGEFDLGTSTSSIGNDGLTVSLNGHQSATVYANGAGDVISQTGAGLDINATGSVTVTANGAGDTITLANGSNTVNALGANDVITVGIGSNTVVATGSGVHINVDTNSGGGSYTVGQNAIVTFAQSLGDGTHDDTIVISNDQTGATSSGTYSFTTLDGAAHNDNISFADNFSDALLGNSLAHSQVNVAAATTLAQALDIAGNIAALTGHTAISANSGVIDWFQFGGNTYVVESVNSGSTAAQHTALGSHDYVVKVTGLVDLSHGALAGSIVTL